jgi:hypothetical protein
MQESPVIYLIPIVAISGSVIMVVAIVWLGARSRQQRAQYRADVQMKLIEKFGSAPEFVKFLESPAGQQFLQEPRSRARDRVAGGVRAGIILTFLALAFFALIWWEHDEGFAVPAFILLALGMAFFVSAAISTKMVKQIPTNDLTRPPTVS